MKGKYRNWVSIYFTLYTTCFAEFPLSVTQLNNGQQQRTATGNPSAPQKSKYLTVTQYLPGTYPHQGNINGAFDSSCVDGHNNSVSRSLSPGVNTSLFVKIPIV